MKKFEKVNLTYSFNALEPYIDEETVRIHYTKHLQAYVDNLNAALKGYEKFVDKKSIEYILSNVSSIPKAIRQTVINQGGGLSNHHLYFYILSPNPKHKPEGKLLKEILNTFGSFNNLKKELSTASLNQFGSGYGWLVKTKKNKLKIINTSNQDSPYSLGYIPLLTIDVWEHAYYLKYKNLRKDYIENIWNIIDFEIIELLYEC
ncbi:Spore coat protein, superoxide dismutase [Clostridium neonatale]|uniref:superoxide dismutase n=1 Tax=Clostridium neonatale TaxID=137838 RepID=UPI00291C2511|nr:superoxide dismutase [Clostridium neonatale]CAI3245067.1 Spore coat protein, superoxide dismutase [Clostridium neonatale]